MLNTIIQETPTMHTWQMPEITYNQKKQKTKKSGKQKTNNDMKGYETLNPYNTTQEPT